jgi:hypothetical protein
MKARTIINEIKREGGGVSSIGVGKAALYRGYNMLREANPKVDEDLYTYRRFVESNGVPNEIADKILAFLEIENEFDILWFPLTMVFAGELNGMHRLERVMEKENETKRKKFIDSVIDKSMGDCTITVLVKFHENLMSAWVTVNTENEDLIRSKDGLIVLMPPK